MEDAFKETQCYFGFFTLITNKTMDTFTVLHLYWMEDVVKKDFVISRSDGI